MTQDKHRLGLWEEGITPSYYHCYTDVHGQS